MSAHRSRPEVIDAPSERRKWTLRGPHHPSGIPAKAHAVVDALASGEKDRMVVRPDRAIFGSKAPIWNETSGTTDAGDFIR